MRHQQIWLGAVVIAALALAGAAACGTSTSSTTPATPAAATTPAATPAPATSLAPAPSPVDATTQREICSDLEATVLAYGTADPTAEEALYNVTLVQVQAAVQAQCPSVSQYMPPA